MSSEVKRYDPDVSRRGDAYMGAKGDGDCVRHEDYVALEAECERLRKEKSARQALSIQLIDEARALRAELAAIKGREPVAIANKGNGVFWVKWTDAGESLRGPGIKLYTLPAAPEGGEA